MGEDTWTAVDEYIARQLIGEDAALDAALQSSAEAGLPAIAVSPPQGKLLHLLARSIGARSVLEIGTLGGYSTIWLARAVGQDGHVLTLEADARYAEVARANIARAGFADTVETPEYFSWALQRTRSGGLIVADNVIRDGAIVDPHSENPGGLAARRLHEMLETEPRVSATTIQTVGLKGYDGFTLMLVD